MGLGDRCVRLATERIQHWTVELFEQRRMVDRLTGSALQSHAEAVAFRAERRVSFWKAFRAFVTPEDLRTQLAAAWRDGYGTCEEDDMWNRHEDSPNPYEER